jgi:hypothetical protein
MEVTNSCKPSSLPQHGTNYDCKRLNSTVPGVLFTCQKEFITIWTGCTQYFYGSTSVTTINSFNYANLVELANQRQNICFR